MLVKGCASGKDVNRKYLVLFKYTFFSAMVIFVFDIVLANTYLAIVEPICANDLSKIILKIVCSS